MRRSEPKSSAAVALGKDAYERGGAVNCAKQVTQDID